MDQDERGPAGRVAVPEESSGEAGIVPQAIEQARVFTQALQAHFQTGGLSQRQFAARYPHYHYSTVSEYLSAGYLPELDFVDKVLETVEASYGSPVTEETRQHLYDLHLAAAEAIGGIPHRVRVLTDELRVEVVHREQAQQQVHALAEALADRRAQDEQVRSRIRELQNAANADQIRFGAELTLYEGENESLREELGRLKATIATLEQLLDQANTRRIQAEEQCKTLERSLLDAEGTAEQERLAQQQLREAEEREQSRQAEQQRLQQALDEVQNKAAERERELRAENLAAADRVRAAEERAQRRTAELVVYKATEIQSSLESAASGSLSPIKLQVLSLLAAGATYTAVAEQLTVTEAQLERYITQIAAKLQVSSLGDEMFASDGTRTLTIDLNQIRSLLKAAERRRAEQLAVSREAEAQPTAPPPALEQPRQPVSDQVPASDQPRWQERHADLVETISVVLLFVCMPLGVLQGVAYGWLAGGHGVHMLGAHPSWGGSAALLAVLTLTIVGFGLFVSFSNLGSGHEPEYGLYLAGAVGFFLMLFASVALISMVFHLVAPGEAAVFGGIEHFSRIIRGWSMLQF